MPKHDFLKISSKYYKDNHYINSLISYYFDNGLDRNLYISIDDSNFLYLSKFLKNFKSEWANGTISYGLDYYGISKIHYNNLLEFKSLISECIQSLSSSNVDIYVESDSVLLNKNLAILELSEIIKFIDYSISNNSFLLHLGI